VPKPVKKWLKRAAISLVLTIGIAWVGGAWLLHCWTAKPPPLPADTRITQLKPQERDGKTCIGQCWIGKREGLPVISLKGSPFELGYAAGVLQQRQIHTLETEFLLMLHGYVPSDVTLRVLKWYVIYRNRHLSDFIPLDYRLEIYGSVLGCPDSHPELGDYYNRVLNYHAAHDVSYMMIDNPLVSKAGCTAFGAWGSATAGGHLLTGRNFDWEAADVFSRERVVIMCEPDHGIPFISLAWPGMAGVVSGMNRAGVAVTINGAPSRLPRETATPVAIIARQILQNARNLQESLDILRASKVFVSTLWLIGSRADGKFVVVERTPDAMHVREPAGDSIICANHFQTAGLKDDPRNRNEAEGATSLSRQIRMAELLKETHGSMTATQAVAILRDRRLSGGQFAGNGNRRSLNAFIATHSTVMDLTDGIFWAASPPHQLGKFVAFDVQDFTHELPEATIPEDSTLTSGEYDKAVEAEHYLEKGFRALKKHDGKAALEMAEKAESLNPGFYECATLKGRALLALGRKSEATAAFQAALTAQPAFLAERTELQRLLRTKEPD
jgi:isopenicillin-N N-acyltransferase like protein